jgi:nucleoside-diphosphate-sugar epimerase
MPASAAELIGEIRRAAPPGQPRLDAASRARLGELTAALLAVRPDSVAELDRYLAVRRRGIALPAGRAGADVRGRTVVVTGGSGCVGTALLRELARLRPGRLVSVAITAPARPVPGVEYVSLDIRRSDLLGPLFRQLRPRVVFHLAAERDPGLAERQLARTLGTNLAGTVNVAEAAERSGVHRLVYASTGKAVRPYTAGIYAGSKRIGEWLIAATAARGAVHCSGVRFTHVVDNAIIRARLNRWCETGDAVRLHSSDTHFYAQSARESAQTLLAALLAPADQQFRLHVLRDLGWPISLLDIALGTMIRTGTASPLYLAGHEPGYEDAPYPGLYDPLLAGDISPLVNALEAGSVTRSGCPGVDTFPAPGVLAPDVLAVLPELTAPWVRPDAVLRRRFEEAAWALFEATARAAPPTVLNRIVTLTERHRPAMSPEHLRIDDVFRAGAGGAVHQPHGPRTSVG